MVFINFSVGKKKSLVMNVGGFSTMYRKSANNNQSKRRWTHRRLGFLGV